MSPWSLETAVRGRPHLWRTIWISALFCLLCPNFRLFGQVPGRTKNYELAFQQYRQGQLEAAEETLKTILKVHPSDPKSLELLGIVLDAGRRCEEAESVYKSALKLTPGAASLWGNLGNHFVTCGNSRDAQHAYKKAVELDPANVNATLQLAQIYLAQNSGRSALGALSNLRNADAQEPAVQILRARALFMLGELQEGENTLSRLQDQFGSDPRVSFQIGMVYIAQKQYEPAEKAFARALALRPTDYDILYNLGLAAARAGNYGRAADAFKAALSQRPEDVDCLYNLALVYAQSGHEDQGIILLVKAKELAPRRPEILMLMARMTDRLGFYQDTAELYDEYLQLRPDDDVARRERGFSLARAGKLADGMKDLEWYVQKHPDDPAGLYELGVAESTLNAGKAEEHFTRALTRAPEMAELRYARALLFNRQGRHGEAVEDARHVLKAEPKNAHALDVLGESLLQLGRIEEAAEALERAVQLDPGEPKFLMHFSRALFRVGRSKEAKEVVARFEKIKPDDFRRQRRRGGLLQYLNLPEAGQRAQYLANLKRDVNLNPGDLSLKIRLAKALLGEGETEEALAIYDEIRSKATDPAALAGCGTALLEHGQYGKAAEFLNAAFATGPPTEGLRLDLAIALFHSAGPQSALAELEKVPLEVRDGDYHLLRAQILDAMGRPEEASEELNRGFRASPTRPDLYFEAALFLIKHGMHDQSLSLLQQAEQIVPGHPELLLMKAVALFLSERAREAESQLTEIEAGWPEWYMPYLFKGTILLEQLRIPEAIPQLESAIVLGARQPEAYYNLAVAYTISSPPDYDLAGQTIQQAIELRPRDADILGLAGKIALKTQRYEEALTHLKEAIRLDPNLVAARISLSATYRALGDEQKSLEEMKRVEAIKQRRAGNDEQPSPITSFLFTVGPPMER